MSDELDDILDGADDEGDSGRRGSNPENDRRLSQTLHREQKAREAAEKRLAALEAELEKRNAEKRAEAIAAAARELGIKEKHIGFYSGEPDLEAIKQWAVDNEFIPAEGERTSDEKARGFVPGGFDSSPEGRPTGEYTADEVLAMYFEGDKARALKLLQTGKVRGISAEGELNRNHPDYDIDYGGKYRVD